MNLTRMCIYSYVQAHAREKHIFVHWFSAELPRCPAAHGRQCDVGRLAWDPLALGPQAPRRYVQASYVMLASSA